jgi:hypothetical protein
VFVAEHLLGVGEHRPERLGPLRPADHLVTRVQSLGVVVERTAIGEGNAEDLGDHEAGHLAGEVRYQVALAAFDDLIDDTNGQLGDAWPHQLRRPRGELAADQTPHAGVHRRIGHQHHDVITEGSSTVAAGVGDHDRG